MDELAQAPDTREQDLRDPAVFRAFYREAVPRMYGYFFTRCGGSREVAEDLTQETFTAAVKALRGGATPDVPLAWLTGIARHKLTDHYRRREREARRLEALRSEEETSAEIVWDDDRRDDAIAALDAVAGPQRAALVLRYLDGMSVPEVADLIGKSIHATESLLARGRLSFKRAFEEAGHA